LVWGVPRLKLAAIQTAMRFQVKNLGTLPSLSIERLGSRSGLLAKLDAQRRLHDLNGSADAVDEFTRKALDLVTGSQARDAFDIGREPDAIREAYGRSTVGQSLLLARRLVEAGVTCVTVRVTGWDDHSDIAKGVAGRAPAYDQGLAALVGDLYQRGLEQEVLVVAMGEFGRTPKVNKNAGRDHWGSLMSVLLAGGKLQRGVFGQSNPKGEVPTAMPYRPENVLATIYRHLGIDPSHTYNDFSGRPPLHSGRVGSHPRDHGIVAVKQSVTVNGLSVTPRRAARNGAVTRYPLDAPGLTQGTTCRNLQANSVNGYVWDREIPQRTVMHSRHC
jgi:hypothetical protein